MELNLSQAVYAVEYFYAKPGQRDRLIQALKKLVTLTRQEEGCLQYDLLLDDENPNLAMIIMKYVNATRMTAHEQQPYIKDFIANEMEQCCEKVVWNIAKEILP